MKSISFRFFASFSVLTFFALAIFPACVKTEFDEPPVGGSPVNVTANKTIGEIKSAFPLAQNTFVVLQDTTDWIIKGQVIMDDKSGNFYKTLVIQDASSGIEVKFNDGYLYNKYPIGRNVYINLRGLVLSDYNGVVSINGGTVVENGVTSVVGLSSPQVEAKVFKGEFEPLIAPKVKKINELYTSDISTLVQIDDVEFANADVNKTYADPVGRTSLNRKIQDCNQLTVLLRSSGYSNFAAALTPAGKGSIVGVYSVYRQDQQLFIRDTNDVKLTGPRCGVNTNLTAMSIADLRAAFASGATSGPQDKKITGVVISDRSTNNLNGRNLIIQDGNAGILVRFTANHTYDLGDKIEVNVSGLELSEFNKVLQVNNVPANNAIKIGSGTVAPREATVAEILQNLNSWESTLVKVKNAQFDRTGVFKDNPAVLDNTANIATFTNSNATFANEALPTGTIEVTGIVSEFTSGPQLSLRSKSDVTGGTQGGGITPVASISESFNGITNNVAFSANGWKNVAVKGTRTWQGKTFNSDKYVQATSFNSSDPEEEMWLITPPIDLSSQKTLSFRSAMAFWKHDGLSVYYSPNFDGTNVSTATWTQLTATLAGSGSGDNTWVDSGNITLPVIAKGYIGFKYVGNSAANTTTFRLDDIKVQ